MQPQLADIQLDYVSDPVAEEDRPSARIFIPSPNQRSSNYIHKLNSILRKLPPLVGLVNPPSIAPLLSPSVERTVVDFPTIAHHTPPMSTTHPHMYPPCICDHLKPPISALHPHAVPIATTTGRRHHLLSVDSSFYPDTVPYQVATKLLQLPLTFRPNGPSKLSIIYTLCRKALRVWFDSYFDSSHELAFHLWLAPLIQAHKRLTSATQNKRDLLSSTHKDPLPSGWSSKIKNCPIAFARSDKGNHLVASCPILAHVMLGRTMAKGDRYEPTTLTPSQWRNAQASSLFQSTGKHYHVYPAVPIMRIQPKDHKDGPCKFRPVCSHLRRGAYDAETHLLKILQLVSADIPQQHVVSSTFQTQTRIPSHTTHVSAHDIEGMFDALHIDQAYARIAAFITRSFHKHGPRINTSPRKSRWSKSTTPANPHEFHTLSQALALLHHILYEDYCIAGSIIFHSTSGVPMGGRCSSLLSCLCCSSIEILLLPLAKAHYPNFFYLRYCDDVICSLSPNQFHSLFDKHFLQIGMKFVTSALEPNGGVAFLESTYHCTPLGISARHFCKRFQLFIETDLPHRGSASAVSTQLSQITSSAIRFYRAASTPENFANALTLQHQRNPSYPRSLFARAFSSILTAPNRYNVLFPLSHPAHTAIQHGSLLPYT